MASQRIADFLPDVYQDIFPDFFGSEIPEETVATCARCAMWPDPASACSSRRGFSKQTKCCTYHPELPNYLVGALLSSRSRALATGRERLRSVISSRIGVMPQGVRRPAKHALLTTNAPDAFGRSATLVCPYYARHDGRCTIRPLWNAVCNTWFCKHNAGQDGWLFWQSLKRYLSDVETALTQYALHELGWPADQIIRPHASDPSLTSREVDDLPLDREAYGALWRDWVGREEALYRKTYRVAAALSRAEFEGLMGIAHTILLDDLRKKHQAQLEPKLPNVLKRNPELRTEKVDNSYVLIGYSPLDPLMASKRVYDMLDFFDGRRANEQVCRLIEKEFGGRPSQELVLSLYQLRILVDAKA